jgi:hypothetical protein
MKDRHSQLVFQQQGELPGIVALSREGKEGVVSKGRIKALAMIEGINLDGEAMGQADFDGGSHIVESRLKTERGCGTGAVRLRCGESQHIAGKARAADCADGNRLRWAGTTSYENDKKIAHDRAGAIGLPFGMELVFSPLNDVFLVVPTGVQCGFSS